MRRTLGGRHQAAELDHPVGQAGEGGEQQVQPVGGLHRRGEHDGGLAAQLLRGAGVGREGRARGE